MSESHRIEKDSLGEVRVPADALYGAQTQRAVENFPISGRRFGRRFIEALGRLKEAARALAGRRRWRLAAHAYWVTRRHGLTSREAFGGGRGSVDAGWQSFPIRR